MLYEHGDSNVERFYSKIYKSYFLKNKDNTSSLKFCNTTKKYNWLFKYFSEISFSHKVTRVLSEGCWKKTKHLTLFSFTSWIITQSLLPNQNVRTKWLGMRYIIFNVIIFAQSGLIFLIFDFFSPCHPHATYTSLQKFQSIRSSHLASYGEHIYDTNVRFFPNLNIWRKS